MGAVSNDEEARRDEQSDGPKLARTLAKIPSAVLLVAALVMPVVCVVFTCVWASQGEDEDLMKEVWTRESSPFYKDEEYKRSLGDKPTTSNFFVISRHRNGGDLLQAELLKDVETRLSDIQSSTKVTIDGMEFSYQDVCYNPAGPYLLPCLRFTLLDCFAEGGYDFPATAALYWQNLVLAQINGLMRSTLLSTAIAGHAAMCGPLCTIDGAHAALAPFLPPGTPVGTWFAQPTCAACIEGTMNNAAVMQVYEDQLYYGAVKGVLAQLQPAMAAVIMTLPNAALDAQIQQIIDTQVGIQGKTPYTCEGIQQKFTCNAPVGGPRPQLKDAGGAYLGREEVRSVVRQACFNWDEGQQLPAYDKNLFYGGVKPSLGAENYTSMEAMSNLYVLMTPQGIRERVGASAARPGGTVQISDAQAKRVLEEFKVKFEAEASKGWDDDSQRVEFTAFSDDEGGGGTTRVAMGEMNRKSEVVMWVFYIFLPFITAALFIQCFRNPLVESKTALLFVGTIVVMLGTFAAFGITALTGYKLNIVHYAILPFLLVGIGVDDLFIVAMSTQRATEEASVEARFLKSVQSIINPITMTSTMNAVMFMVLWIACDVAAIYKVTWTGFWGICFLYINVLTSFMPLLLLDLRRQAANRCDVLPCIQRPTPEEPRDDKYAGCTLNKLFYKKIFDSTVAKCVIILVSLILLVVACIGFGDFPVGLNIEEFFTADTQAATYAKRQAELFPTWPAKMNWGEVDYMSAGVQMKMAKQFEEVQTSKYVSGGLATTMVWTAALAKWSIPPAFAIPYGACLPQNQLTGGQCGALYGCEATWVENSLGLKLSEQSNGAGICYSGETLINSLPASHPWRSNFTSTKQYCATAQWNPTQLQHCYSKWQALKWGQIVNPAIKIENATEGTPRVPVRYSSAGGEVLFSINTHTSEDYVELIKETRKHVDDDGDIRAWMSGIAYEYWEQYIDIVDFTFKVGALSVAFGFLAAFIFLLVQFSLEHSNSSFCKRLLVAFASALLVAVICMMSMLTVVGFCAWFRIRFSVFTSTSCILSTGFTVEYTVHIIHGYVASCHEKATERVHMTMDHVAWPTFMAFLTSLISVIMLVFVDVQFMVAYFFGPLCLVMVVTFFNGVFLLPSILGVANFMPMLHDIKNGGGQPGQVHPAEFLPEKGQGKPNKFDVTSSLASTKVPSNGSQEHDEPTVDEL